jgi:hypothetical protein
MSTGVYIQFATPIHSNQMNCLENPSRQLVHQNTDSMPYNREHVLTLVEQNIDKILLCFGVPIECQFLSTKWTGDGLVSTMRLPNSFVAAYNEIGLGRLNQEFTIRVASYAEHKNKEMFAPLDHRGQTFNGILTLNPTECVEVSRLESENPMYSGPYAI